MSASRTTSTSGNRTLSSAKTAKQDEFYTQLGDIQKEIEASLEFDPDTLRGKVVYCNCDDPFESNFFKYFATNFNKLERGPGEKYFAYAKLAAKDAEFGCRVTPSLPI